MRNAWAVVGLAAALGTLAATQANAQHASRESSLEFSVLGGIHVLNENDTAFPDQLISIPAVAALSYRLAPNWALDGELTWMIPVEQSVEVGAGPEQDRKAPDILAYQANVRGIWPLGQYEPYLVTGVGALTVLSNTDADRLPQVEDTETMFALNFGGGLSYPFGERWALRADFREFVAFPSDDAAGLSNTSGADEIWMERVSLGLGYRF